jgi:hypothetical protein
LEDGADRFFHSGLEKPARVDDGDVCFFQVSDKRIFLFREPSQDVLAVHQVLRAPEADDADFVFGFQN